MDRLADVRLPAPGTPGGRVWTPPESGESIPWSRIELSLRAAHRLPSPHQLSPWQPEAPRRAAVAVLLWGNAEGAQSLVLARRGLTAPHHAGELAFPGGMVDPSDRDLPATARRELAEELGVRSHLWELGCFPDGVAKARTRFTPVLFRWEAPEPRFEVGPELDGALVLPLDPLLRAPWETETLIHHALALEIPRLELRPTPLWGATAYILKAWLDLLEKT